MILLEISKKNSNDDEIYEDFEIEYIEILQVCET
jgi:hypothetical protein